MIPKRIDKSMENQSLLTYNGEEAIVVYQSEDNTLRLDVQMAQETVWLSQQQMAELFNSTIPNISIHIRNIFKEGELASAATCKEFLQVQIEGTREIQRSAKFYNLDVIIAVGYRVRSQRGTQFRKWATERLKEYIVKGFTIDVERLKGNAGGQYWYDLLATIKDIRSSEKVLYRQVLDLYATSVDYNAKAEDTILLLPTFLRKCLFRLCRQASEPLRTAGSI